MLNNSIYEVVKEKTNVKGFWKDSNGKIYVDNIKLKSINNPFIYQTTIEKLFAKGEKAVFYQVHDKAYVLFASGEKIKLENRILEHHTSLRASYIKELLSKFEGVTVYRNKAFNDYTVEVWY